MKKGMLLIAVAVALVAVLASGATFAIFTGSASNNNKTFASGTVDIDSYRDGFDTIPGPMFYTTVEEGQTPTNPPYPGLKPTGIWAPGDTHIRFLVVYNKGSLDAVLDQVKAEVISDPNNMASQMNVAIYKILPIYLPDGTPFAPLPGDDCMDQELINHTSNLINPFILMGYAYGVTGLAQALLEHAVQCYADLLWCGKLSDLTAGYRNLNPVINMKSVGNPFIKRGCLLAFVVQFDKNANNGYQGAQAKFGFTVKASQKANVYP